LPYGTLRTVCGYPFHPIYSVVLLKLSIWIGYPSSRQSSVKHSNEQTNGKEPPPCKPFHLLSYTFPFLLVATSDGAIRVLDRSLSASNRKMFPLPSSNARRPATPFLLPTNKGALLKAHLQRGCSEGRELFASAIPPSLHRRLRGDKSIMITRADQTPSLPERCKIVASFFGDLKGAFAALGACMDPLTLLPLEMQFWALADVALKKFPRGGTTGFSSAATQTGIEGEQPRPSLAHTRWEDF